MGVGLLVSIHRYDLTDVTGDYPFQMRHPFFEGIAFLFHVVMAIIVASLNASKPESIVSRIIIVRCLS